MTKGSLKSHMQSMHEGVNYPCELCEHKAKQRPGLKRHMALVHNIGKELLCEQCDFQTRHNEKLKKHVKIKHEGIKKVCDKCCKTFSERKHLQRHMDSVHNNVRFQCDQCDKITTQKGDLIRHIKKYMYNDFKKIPNFLGLLFPTKNQYSYLIYYFLQHFHPPSPFTPTMLYY